MNFTKEPWWLRSVYGCSPVAGGLEFWISGPAARAMEGSSDAEVLAGLHRLLRRAFREAPEPNGLVRSRWSNVVKLKVDYDTNMCYVYIYSIHIIITIKWTLFPLCMYVYIYT